ncbi:MAG: sulfotransferase [Candidatus Bathyarchaeota archaeon]
MTEKKSWVDRLFGLNMWYGMSLGNWVNLLSKHQFTVDTNLIPRALLTTCQTTLNSAAGFLEKAVYEKEIDKTELVAPPIFILGYWRTGTTHLHNLLSKDERFTYPTTYTCMFPNHFLLTESIGKKLLSLLIPEKRPMDKMQLSWESPQEDEVALALLGGLSPYIDFAFTDSPETHHRFLDFEHTTAEERELFQQLIAYFVQKHTLRSRKRVLLKSPTHTFRIKLLAKAFPEAKFIHIYRNPVRVFFSAVHTFTILREQVGLTKPDNSRLEQRIIEDMISCYRHVQKDRALLAPNQFHEIRFENLEKQPLKELESAYQKLDIGGFKAVLPRLEAYLDSIANYRKNVYAIPLEKKRQLAEKLAPILKTYGYQMESV